MAMDREMMLQQQSENIPKDDAHQDVEDDNAENNNSVQGKKIPPEAVSAKNRIFVTKIHPKTLPKEVEGYFRHQGPIKDFYMPKRPDGSHKGIAFVSFQHEMDAQRVIENDHYVAGKPVVVDQAQARPEKDSNQVAEESLNQSKRIFLSPVPLIVSSGMIASYFAQFGTIVDVFVPKGKGICFVSFADFGVAKKCVDMGQHVVCNIEMNAEWASTRAEAKNGQPVKRVIDEGKIFVVGLKNNQDEYHVKEYFRQFGAVKDCFMPKDKQTGLSRGIAFVTFKKPDGMIRVMNHPTRHDIMGSLVTIEQATSREPLEGEEGLIQMELDSLDRYMDSKNVSKDNSFADNMNTAYTPPGFNMNPLMPGMYGMNPYMDPMMAYNPYMGGFDAYGMGGFPPMDPYQQQMAMAMAMMQAQGTAPDMSVHANKNKH